jgi:hypothetical protein
MSIAFWHWTNKPRSTPTIITRTETKTDALLYIVSLPRLIIRRSSLVPEHNHVGLDLDVIGNHRPLSFHSWIKLLPASTGAIFECKCFDGYQQGRVLCPIGLPPISPSRLHHSSAASARRQMRWPRHLLPRDSVQPSPHINMVPRASGLWQ